MRSRLAGDGHGGVKMIKEINQTCEKLNDTLGISVTLPNPKKNALKEAAIYNLVIGAGLTTAGIIFPSKACTVLGGIGILSSVVLCRESRGRAKES